MKISVTEAQVFYKQVSQPVYNLAFEFEKARHVVQISKDCTIEELAIGLRESAAALERLSQPEPHPFQQGASKEWETEYFYCEICGLHKKNPIHNA